MSWIERGKGNPSLDAVETLAGRAQGAGEDAV
jgi:hypothetical protein